MCRTGDTTAALPVGSRHVALSLRPHGAGPLLDDVVARLQTVAEGSVAVVGALIEDHRSVFVRAGGGSSEGQQAGKDGLVDRKCY